MFHGWNGGQVKLSLLGKICNRAPEVKLLMGPESRKPLVIQGPRGLLMASVYQFYFSCGSKGNNSKALTQLWVVWHNLNVFFSSCASEVLYYVGPLVPWKSLAILWCSLCGCWWHCLLLLLNAEGRGHRVIYLITDSVITTTCWDTEMIQRAFVSGFLLAIPVAVSL
jgi:hypothetical protein